MNFKELLEGAEPSMPGAPSGIKIMTPQQFVANAGDEEVDEDITSTTTSSPHGPAAVTGIQARDWVSASAGDRNDKETLANYQLRIMDRQAELELSKKLGGLPPKLGRQGTGIFAGMSVSQFQPWLAAHPQVLDAILKTSAPAAGQSTSSVPSVPTAGQTTMSDYKKTTEGQEHLDRIRKLSGLDEATKLPAQARDLGGQEFQDYMKRIVGTPDVDKAGNVKVDKKGNEKYVSGKTKSDKYKMPYIHRSSVVTYMSPDGKSYDEDAVKQTLAQRPKALLKQNEKMKHSNGELEQFFNVGFAALVGIALDQDTNNLIVVNTCPGAGSCKVDCFAMKGGKIQFKAAWQSDGRILTYLLNDPDGFFSQLSGEISKEAQLGKKGGYTVTIRWHDAGDFFSPEYLDMALKMAAKHPDVKFYAYTKMAGAALADKPDNFIINWSEGAHTSQEKQVKASDANLDTTKNSRIVPDQLFQDLLIKDEKGNLVKGGEGQWQVQPEKLPELKQRLAKQYGLSSNSILSYDEYIAKRKSIPAGMKYNVIVAPGEGDISANDPNIISTLLLRH
jgi:hypothetical protein